MLHEKLNFYDCVDKYFSFLEKDYGFKMINKSLYLIEYKKGNIIIELYHERISYEFYIVITLKEEYAYLNQIFECYKKPTRFYQGSTLENVEFCTKSLSEELKIFLKEIYTNEENELREIIKKANSSL